MMKFFAGAFLTIVILQTVFLVVESENLTDTFGKSQPDHRSNFKNNAGQTFQHLGNAGKAANAAVIDLVKGGAQLTQNTVSRGVQGVRKCPSNTANGVKRRATNTARGAGSLLKFGGNIIQNTGKGINYIGRSVGNFGQGIVDRTSGQTNNDNNNNNNNNNINN
ncbi:putative uncharacterized protein DDB_G0286901 [Contarinia nasturtii]|uniref:putative uncharacterized protein DDB_G0286901 n=1 Tax=Contarinia nasturtii TaxID=265458 RepID=UPI0012D49EED|nr:putative uncharacterized protein DDB_G0286901 [Contarinia nasturtii]